MKYHLNDKFILNGIECHVAFINSKEHALLVPEYDENGLLKGVVFAELDTKGRSKDGKKAIPVNNTDCCAV